MNFQSGPLHENGQKYRIIHILLLAKYANKSAAMQYLNKADDRLGGTYLKHLRNYL